MSEKSTKVHVTRPKGSTGRTRGGGGGGVLGRVFEESKIEKG